MSKFKKNIISLSATILILAGVFIGVLSLATYAQQSANNANFMPSLDYPPAIVAGQGDLIKEYLFPNKVFKATSPAVSLEGVLVSEGIWEAEFKPTEKAVYRVFVKTINEGEDLTAAGLYHQIHVYLNDQDKGIFYNLASLNPQTGGVVLGNLDKDADYTIRFEWTNKDAAKPNFKLAINSFGVEKGEVHNDVIGIRTYKNPENLLIADWYAKNAPNPGKPESLTVGGYEALRDSRTVYVNVTNVESVSQDPLTGSVTAKTYGVVYLMSYNEGATAETIDIFNQMLKNWQFYPKKVETPAEAEEVKRDRQREMDIKAIKKLLEDHKTKKGYYPRLEAGTYLKGETNSKWSSWQTVLAVALGKTLPVDPVNKFKGSCSDCPNNPEKSNYQCGGTCWNEEEKRFEWPLPDSPQLVYRYSTADRGATYKLEYETEYGKGCKLNQCEDPFCPANKFGVHCCEVGDMCPMVIEEGGEGSPTTGGIYVSTDYGTTWTIGEAPPRQCVAGTYCVLGNWRTACGNGLVQSGEDCDTGGIQRTYREDCKTSEGYQGTQNRVCQSDCRWGNKSECLTYETCGDGVINGLEKCDEGSKNGVACPAPYKRDSAGVCQYCAANCKELLTSAGPYCGDSKIWTAEEKCDNGKQNGVPCVAAYGKTCEYCSADCNKIITVAGSACGDGQIDAGEECDKGSDNTKEESNNKVCVAAYGGTCEYCSSDCKKAVVTGPACGDGAVNGLPDQEQCDGAGGLNLWSCPGTQILSCASDCKTQCSGGGQPTKIVENGYKIVLTWGSEPKDLDAHLEFGSGTTHIYYAHKDLTNGAQMDVDDTNGEGPEIITIKSLFSEGKALNYYRYYVYNSSRDGFKGDAKVEIFNTNNEVIRKFDISKASGFASRTGATKFWYVFDIDPLTGKIFEMNTMFDQRVKPAVCGDGRISYLNFEQCEINSDVFDDIACADGFTRPICQECRYKCPKESTMEKANSSESLTDSGNKITLHWLDKERPVYSYLKFGDNLVSSAPGASVSVNGVDIVRDESKGEETISINSLLSDATYEYYVCQDTDKWWWGLEEVQVRNGKDALLEYDVPSSPEKFDRCWRVFNIEGNTRQIIRKYDVTHPFYCGNKIKEGTEQCDDGGQNGLVCAPPYPNGSCTYCDTHCAIKTLRSGNCGDGAVNGTEQCDNGSRNGLACVPSYPNGACSYCDNHCAIQTSQAGNCGDDVINGPEQCDNGSRNGLACVPSYPNGTCSYCDTNCAVKTLQAGNCGDGAVNGTEQCDDGSRNGLVCAPPYPDGTCSYCDTNCAVKTLQAGNCGDGAVNGTEQCDDGDDIDSVKQNGLVCAPPYPNGSCSYCDNDCAIQTLQAGHCGDGVINGPEQCDDGGQNGAVCVPDRGCPGTCNYCNTDCQLKTETTYDSNCP